jgi:hypothetical protein
MQEHQTNGERVEAQARRGREGPSKKDVEQQKEVSGANERLQHRPGICVDQFRSVKWNDMANGKTTD